MYEFTAAQQKKTFFWLVLFHISITVASNYLVQFPLQTFGIFTTWGVFSFPFIFLVTDLIVCIFGAPLARWIIFWAMFPTLLLSCVSSAPFHDGNWTGRTSLTEFNAFVGRTALASSSVYVPGQILDIFMLSRLRRLRSRWIAPTASTIVGNALDTLVFFVVTFYTNNDEFMATNWQGIAFVDYLFKLAICTLFFLPAYGIIPSTLTKKLISLNVHQEMPESALAR